ncbi:MAG: valine--tRNA ligase [Actinomycetia bacterium]|nr:valine--tRNA ligase [Actinomycetes bacterium]
MSDLPKTFEPADIEEPLFAAWADAGYFRRDSAGFAENSLSPYTIVIPPPNVTGVLHMGHALNNSLQDILIRRARMQGRPTRWIVGTDHAGIATQNRVEQKLASEGLDRFDIGREVFVQKCWDWRRQYGSTIIGQLKGMGCSCDFDDEKFTMDPGYALAIRKVFVQWYHQGLIYRGLRIINWCPRCTTALADDEVEHIDECGHLWYLRYPLVEPVGETSYLVVATTRPETMLGDSGVAVNPTDERYVALLAAEAKIRLPLMDRVIPLVGDNYVDASFGTGAVKVTPAHDPNDFEIGQRHSLEQINIFNDKAEVNELGGRFAGLSREAAREAVVAAFEELGLLDHVEEHEHAVGHCYRCNTTVEPWASEQWFVRMQQLAAPAIAAVRDGRVRFNPQRWENVYFHWMENIRDWCISRQLWWGHRIPVFYCASCGWHDALEDNPDRCPKCGAAVRQDDDVLDTWFSSQLWPFATYGWPYDPKQAAELDAYYPTQVLSTARDIIFLWVARMIMSSLSFLDDAVPFTDVIIHPTVLDKSGNIMSKSRGNGIDPMELIAEFGADVMRFGLAAQVTGSQDMRFDKDKLAVYRNFATKIFNAARFVQMNLDDYRPLPGRVQPLPATLADRWILARLARLTAQLEQDQSSFNFGAQAHALYAFFWNEFCDWYIEFAKGQLAGGGNERQASQRNLVFVLDTALRLLHPMMPFLTESIWLQLPHGDERPSLVVAHWPNAAELAGYLDDEAERSIELTCTVVGAVRSTRARYRLAARTPLAVSIRLHGDTAAVDAALLKAQAEQVVSMAVCSDFSVGQECARPPQSVAVIAEGLEIFIKLEGQLDFEAERQRLKKEMASRRGDADRLGKKLANQGFMAKAASDVIEKTKNDLAVLEVELKRITAELEELG